MCHDELKHLDTRRNNLKKLLKELFENLKNEFDFERQIKLRQKVKRVEKELHEIRKSRKILYDNSNNVIITEHAIVRYFERVLGYDISEIKSQIVPDKTAEQIRICKSGVFPVNNFKLRVKKGTIVTLVKEN